MKSGISIPKTTGKPVIGNYYSINEEIARHAKDMNSFYSYKAGSATAEYRSEINVAAEEVEAHKKRVDPMYHEKIDRMFDRYCKALAGVINQRNSIDTRCPSVMISGGSNFPVRKKEKQNAARDRNMKDWQNTEKYLKKILSVGTAGISSDDENAVKKLKAKLATLEEEQEEMKRINAYFRKNKTLEGCPGLSGNALLRLKAEMSRDNSLRKIPYHSYMLSNNNANMKRIKDRISELEKKATTDYTGWSFAEGTVVFDKTDNRIRILYDGKPDEATRTALKSYGFRWSPKNSAWQRQITNSAISSAKVITGFKKV